MIDDYTTTMELLVKMEAQLPIPIYLTRTLTQLMRGQGVRLVAKQAL